MLGWAVYLTACPKTCIQHHTNCSTAAETAEENARRGRNPSPKWDLLLRAIVIASRETLQMRSDRDNGRDMGRGARVR